MLCIILLFDFQTVDLYDRPWPSDGDKNASNATPSPNVLIAEFRGMCDELLLNI